MLICIGMLLLYNLLQCLLFITVIDLSRTCDNIATLIYNALIMLMIYSWIKIKLKLLIFPTIRAYLGPVFLSCSFSRSYCKLLLQES
jgi:hypothetical protein